tara:strand:- start:62 stop:286 length:225 start_codon:yes stop_codon:yes gene_type:complete
MKEVIVNRLKLKCSKGRIEKGETVILPDAEVAKIMAFRADSITVLRDAPAPAKPAAEKPTRKLRNAKSTPFHKN